MTENVRDFRPLAGAFFASGDSHAGLVLTTQKRWPRDNPGALLAALNQLLAETPKQPTDSELWL